METVKYSLVYNRKNQLTKKGTSQIEVCAYLSGKRKYFNTNINIFPDQWDNTRKRIKNKTANAEKFQKSIYDFIEKLQGFEFERRNLNKPFSLEYLKECLEGKIFKYFTDFMIFEIKNNKTDALSTITVKKTTFNELKKYKENISFDEIVNYEVLKGFENHLIDKGLGKNTIHKYIRNVKTYVNLAINKGFIDLNKYPFRNFKVKTTAVVSREFLNPNEIDKIENLIFTKENKYLEKIRDMFLFSCYTGLRFSDICCVSKECLKDRNNGIWLEMKMQKTSEYIKIPLYILHKNKPIEILKKYESDRLYYFDDYTNQYVNRCIKEIAKITGIEKRVTFHTARHTTATFLLYKGVNITTVQKFLGHAKVQTTQIYAKVMDMTMINELSKIEY